MDEKDDIAGAPLSLLRAIAYTTIQATLETAANDVFGAIDD